MKKTFQTTIDSLDIEKIDKLVLSTYEWNLSEPYEPKKITFESADKELIEKWINLLKKMELKERDEESLFGGFGYYLYFYNGDETTEISSIMLPNIYGKTKRMLSVENYLELYSEFTALEKAMGLEE